MYLIYILLLFNLRITAQEYSRFEFASLPYLQNMGNEGVSVMWVTNKICKSYIKYGETMNLDQKAISSHDGQIDANMPVQRIRLSNLMPGKTYYYKAVSIEINVYEPYWVRYGDTIASPTYSFTLPAKDVQEFSFLAFNDVHDYPQYFDSVCNKNPDFSFVCYNGDIMDDIVSKEQIVNNLCQSSATTFAGNKPFFYTRGNHETRGAFSRMLKQYIETPNGLYYYSFVWGNTYFIFLDTGEDKPDTNQYYYGLADYDEYRLAQSEWIKGIIKTNEWKSAKHRIVCSHIPINVNESDSEEDYAEAELSKKITPILNEANIDILICGHTHRAKIYKPDKKRNYALVIGGGPFYRNNGEGATYIKVYVDENNISAELHKTDGTLIDKYSTK